MNTKEIAQFVSKVTEDCVNWECVERGLARIFSRSKVLTLEYVPENRIPWKGDFWRVRCDETLLHPFPEIHVFQGANRFWYVTLKYKGFPRGRLYYSQEKNPVRAVKGPCEEELHVSEARIMKSEDEPWVTKFLERE